MSIKHQGIAIPKHPLIGDTSTETLYNVSQTLDCIQELSLNGGNQPEMGLSISATYGYSLILHIIKSVVEYEASRLVEEGE